MPRSAALRLPRISLRAFPVAVPLGRLFRGRGAIVVLGAALLGLVFLQVSLLKLNTAISVNVERAAKLERSNAQARASVSKLDAGRRIQDVAGQLGMVMPAAGSICFLDAKRLRPCSGGDATQAGEGLDPAADVAPLTGTEAAGAGVAQQQAPAQPTPQAQQAPAAAGPPQQVAQPPAQPQQTAAPAQTGAAAPVVQQPPTTAPAPAPAAGTGGTGGLSAATGTGG